MNKVTLSKRMAICAAHHFVAAHESACTGEPVVWGAVCENCREKLICNCNWTELMAPLFEATSIHSNICRC